MERNYPTYARIRLTVSTKYARVIFKWTVIIAAKPQNIVPSHAQHATQPSLSFQTPVAELELKNELKRKKNVFHYH